ncbi:MAG: hypothetical protein WDN02_00440 [Methylovirgula sp.]|uniref:hypothetical protein n=1 Tax=Methylovirgula sp. TaxID=1978224 RepID=UPI0030762559
MEAPSYSKRLIVPLVGAAAAVLIILAVHSVRQFFSSAPEAAAALQEVPAKKLPPSLFFPSLYCAFNDFTHQSIVVAFDFADAFPKGAPPRFDERYEGTRDGTQRFAADQSPTWPYAHDDDGTPTITSPDGATRIVLYGLKLDTGGILLIEAGIRSNDFRNLDGQCRQANFGGRQ